MNAAARGAVREAMYVLRDALHINGAVGAGARLNGALANHDDNAILELKGDAEVLSLVRQMNDRAATDPAGAPYRTQINELAGILGAGAPSQPPAAPATPPAATPPAPSTSAGTFAPLSSQQIAAVNAAMQAGVDAGLLIAPQAKRIADDLSRGIYSYSDHWLIDAVELWFFGGASPAMKDALKPYHSIIDQRDPNDSNTTMAANDPRVKRVAGSAPQSLPPATPPVTQQPLPVSNGPSSLPANAADVLSVLAALGIQVDTETGCIGLNGPPLRSRLTEGKKLPGIKLTVWGAGTAGIAFIGNASGIDPQRGAGGDPERPHVVIKSAGGDGGNRELENAIYSDDGELFIPDGYRNVINRGTDSRGHDSMDEYPVLPNADGTGRVDDAHNVVGQVRVFRPHDFDGNPSWNFGEPGARPIISATSAGMPQSAFDQRIDLLTLRDEVRRLGGNV